MPAILNLSCRAVAGALGRSQKNALNKPSEGLTFENMDPLRIHDLRRTEATQLTERGFNQDVIEKALAHEREGIRAVHIIAEYVEQRSRLR